MALLAYRDSGVTDGGLADIARSFHGPWPYLKMLAEKTGEGGPFSQRVVEAYWVGNELLDRISPNDFGNTVEARFRPRTATDVWRRMAEAIPGGIPHHSFHVFVTYPWVGLLTEQHRGEPVQILDQCRIRWGKVHGIEGDQAVVESQPLEWDGKRLELGTPRLESATLAVDVFSNPASLAVGDWVSLHWTWVCDRLDKSQLDNLKRFSSRQLKMTNDELAHPGPATVLG